MKALVVFAHPEPRSFNGAMRDTALAALADAGHEVKQSDLYAIGFNPVAGPGDFQARINPDRLDYPAEQMAAYESGALAPDIVDEQAKLNWSDFVVFQFPLWWYSAPAILKGWFERVFALGYAYGAGRMFDQGGMRGKRAMLSCTTAGRPTSYRHDGWHGAVEDVLFPLHNGLHFVGFDLLPPMVAYAVKRSTDEVREGYIDEFRRRVLTAETTEPIFFHTLDQFGEDGVLREGVTRGPVARWLGDRRRETV